MTTVQQTMAAAERRLVAATLAANELHEVELIAGRRADAILTLTDADRESALLWFADLAVQGAFVEDVLSPVMRRLARCDDPMLRFAELCEAVRARGEFDDNPVDYAAERDLSCAEEAIGNLRDRLCGAVTWAVQALLTPAGTR